jgi:hypothetical protein
MQISGNYDLALQMLRNEISEMKNNLTTQQLLINGHSDKLIMLANQIVIN